MSNRIEVNQELLTDEQRRAMAAGAEINQQIAASRRMSEGGPHTHQPRPVALSPEVERAMADGRGIAGAFHPVTAAERTVANAEQGEVRMAVGPVVVW